MLLKLIKYLPKITYVFRTPNFPFILSHRFYLFMLITLKDEQLCKNELNTEEEHCTAKPKRKNNQRNRYTNYSSIKENYILCWQNVPGAEYIISIKAIKDILSFIPNCSCTGLVFLYQRLWVFSNRQYPNLIPPSSRNTFFFLLRVN